MRIKPGDVKVGLFVLIGVALLVAGLFVLGATRFLQKKFVEESYFTGNVDGLKVGAPVALRGVRVGKVTRINFSWNIYHRPEPRYVVVEYYVDQRVSMAPLGIAYAQVVQQEVQKGLRARIESQGFTGASILSLEYLNPAEYPPLPVPWTPRHPYVPSAPGQLAEILTALEKTGQSLKEIDFPKLMRLVQQDLAAGERLISHIDQANFPGLSTNLNALLTDLRNVSSQAQSFIGESRGAIQQAHLTQVSSNATQLLTELRAITRKVDTMLGRVNESALNETLANLQRASQGLEAAIHKIKQYPAGAIFGEPPPRAKSVEPPKK